MHTTTAAPRMRSAVVVAAAATLAFAMPLAAAAQTMLPAENSTPQGVAYVDVDTDRGVADVYDAPGGLVDAFAHLFNVDGGPDPDDVASAVETEVFAFSLSFEDPVSASANYEVSARETEAGQDAVPSDPITDEDDRLDHRNAIAWLANAWPTGASDPGETGGNPLVDGDGMPEAEEYAATQLAIWHLSDELLIDATMVPDTAVRERALFLIDEALEKKGDEPDPGDYHLMIEAERIDSTTVSAELTLTSAALRVWDDTAQDWEQLPRMGVANSGLAAEHFDSDDSALSGSGLTSDTAGQSVVQFGDADEDAGKVRGVWDSDEAGVSSIVGLQPGTFLMPDDPDAAPLVMFAGLGVDADGDEEFVSPRLTIVVEDDYPAVPEDEEPEPPGDLGDPEEPVGDPVAKRELPFTGGPAVIVGLLALGLALTAGGGWLRRR